MTGDPLRRAPRDALRRLLRTCQRAAAAVRFTQGTGVMAPTADASALWREQILDQLEPVLTPWLTDSDRESQPTVSATSRYKLVRHGADGQALPATLRRESE